MSAISGNPLTSSRQVAAEAASSVNRMKPIISPHERKRIIIQQLQSANEYTEIMQRVIEVHFANLKEFTGRDPSPQDKLDNYWIHKNHPKECDKLFLMEMNLLVPGFVDKVEADFFDRQGLKKVWQVLKPILAVLALVFVCALVFHFYGKRNSLPQR